MQHRVDVFEPIYYRPSPGKISNGGRSKNISHSFVATPTEVMLQSENNWGRFTLGGDNHGLHYQASSGEERRLLGVGSWEAVVFSILMPQCHLHIHRTYEQNNSVHIQYSFVPATTSVPTCMSVL